MGERGAEKEHENNEGTKGEGEDIKSEEKEEVCCIKERRGASVWMEYGKEEEGKERGYVMMERRDTE